MEEEIGMLEKSEKLQEIEEELKDKLNKIYTDRFTAIKINLKNTNALDTSDISNEILKCVRQIAFIYNYAWENELFIRYKGERFNWSNKMKRDIDYILNLLDIRRSKQKIDEIYNLILMKSELSKERADLLRVYAPTKNFYVLDRINGEFLKVNFKNMMKFYKLFKNGLKDNEKIVKGLGKIQRLIEVSKLTDKEIEEEIKRREEMIKWSLENGMPQEKIREDKEYVEALRSIKYLNLPKPLTPESDLSSIEEFKELWDYIISLLPFPHRLNVSYNPNAKAPRWEQFLNEVMDKKFHTAVKRFLGYTLYYDIHTHIPNIAIFVGEGSNGKSVFLSVIKEILGEANYSVIPVQDIGKRFRNLDLLTSILNIAGDLPRKPLNDTGLLKMLTGNDEIPFEPKYKSPFKSKVKVKHIFSANELPKTEDKTYGFYRRWMIFIFPRIFKKGEADPQLTYKLFKEKEGIFNWMLEGLREYLKTLDLAYPLSIEEVRDIYESASNSLLRFLQEECEEAKGEIIPVDEFYRLYTAYCREKNLTPLKSSAEVSKQITALASYVDRPSKPIWYKGEAKRVYKNIRVKYKPPEERKEFIEEMKSIETWEGNQIEVRFLQDYRFGKSIYKEGQRARMDKETAQDLSNRGIVEILEGEQEDEEEVITAKDIYTQQEKPQQESDNKPKSNEVEVIVLEEFHTPWKFAYDEPIKEVKGYQGERMLLPLPLAEMLEKQRKVKILKEGEDTNGK